MKLAVVVGNPKPRSRTLEAGVLVACKLIGREPDAVIDIIDFGADLLKLGSACVAASTASLQQFDVLVVASPTFKGSYSGVLKMYLDQTPTNGFFGVLALPLMLGAGPTHGMAPDLLLKPVLVELGAICPAQGLYLLDSTYASDPKLDEWTKKTTPLLASYSRPL